MFNKTFAHTDICMFSSVHGIHIKNEWHVFTKKDIKEKPCCFLRERKIYILTINETAHLFLLSLFFILRKFLNVYINNANLSWQGVRVSTYFFFFHSSQLKKCFCFHIFWRVFCFFCFFALYIQINDNNKQTRWKCN